MARVTGFFLLAVAAFCAWMAWYRVGVMQMFAEVGMHRPTAALELSVLILCGVVIPIGLAAILLREK